MGRPIGNSSSDIFVPSGYEYQFGIEFESPIPLLLEIPAVEVSVDARIESFEHAEIPAEGFGFVECAKMASTGKIGILGDTDYGLFKTTIGKWCVAVLWVDLHPSPVVFSFRAVDVVRLPRAESEKVSNFLVFF